MKNVLFHGFLDILHFDLSVCNIGAQGLIHYFKNRNMSNNQFTMKKTFNFPPLKNHKA